VRRESVVYSKAKSFAVRIVKLGRYLNEDMKEYILSTSDSQIRHEYRSEYC